MEFLFGIVFGIASLYIAAKVIQKLEIARRFTVYPIRRSQSYIHSLLLFALQNLQDDPEPIKTQSRDLMAKQSMTVVFVDGNAYWIKDNKFYQASVINGQIDNSTIKTVDTMGMDRVELDKMFFIVQKLTEGKQNDSGDSGFKNL
jgi:hypothetical protein